MDREQVQQEALSALKEKGSGTVVLDTGTGKSKVGIDYMREIKAKFILITSPRTTLKRNWKSELVKWGIKPVEGNKEGLYYDEITKINLIIVIENVQTAYKWSDEEISKFDLVIADEVHTMATKEYGNVVKTAVKNNVTVVGLTATPSLKNADKIAFYILYLPIIYRFEGSAEHGIVNKRRYIVYEYELDNSHRVIAGSKYKKWMAGEADQYKYVEESIASAEDEIKDILDIPRDTEEYVDYFRYAMGWIKGNDSIKKRAAAMYIRSVSARKDLLWNLESSRKLAKLMSYYIRNTYGDKVLIFSERTDHVSSITKYTVHSKNKKDVNETNLQKFDNGEIKELGSCYSLTLGLNIKNAKYAIIESYNGSNTQFKQRSGRVDRLPVNEEAIVTFIVPKNTQAEKWFKQAVTFKENDDVTVVHNINEFKSKLTELNG